MTVYKVIYSEPIKVLSRIRTSKLSKFEYTEHERGPNVRPILTKKRTLNENQTYNRVVMKSRTRYEKRKDFCLFD